METTMKVTKVEARLLAPNDVIVAPSGERFRVEWARPDAHYGGWMDIRTDKGSYQVRADRLVSVEDDVDAELDPFAGLETAPASELLDDWEPSEDRATDKQVGFLTKLRTERGQDADRDGAAKLSKREASAEIERLLNTPKAAAEATPAADAPEGIHLVDGTYYKVQVAVHGSGHKYAKVWDEGTEHWDYAPGAIRRLSSETVVSATEAARFGQLYGRCCFCSRQLTDERSVAVGYGPDCASHHGLPWG